MTDALRVLAVTNMYPTARNPLYGSFVASQMESIARMGARVTVKFVDGQSTTRNYVSGIGEVRRMATSANFDLVHAHYGLAGFVAIFQPLPLVVSFCGDDLLGTSDGAGGVTVKSRIARRASHLAARRADAIICKSDGLRAALPRASDRTRAHIIGNGVDTGMFSPGSRDTARRRLGLAAEERLVLFVFSGSQRVKRLDVAEAAVARLIADGVSARLWVVRDVPHASMPDYYRAADCLLVTSDSEGSPNAVKEALCCDLPLVAVDVGDIARWAALTTESHVVPRDPAAIAHALHDVLARRLRADGRRVRVELSLDLVATRILQVYREAVEARRSRRPRSTVQSH